MRRASVFALFLFGCAHAPPAPHHVHGENGGPARPIPLPFHLVDGKTGAPLDQAALDDRLRSARVIYVGEEHPNPHHHAVEQAVLERVHQLDPSVALGVEMLPRTLQAPLDEYVAARLDEDQFLAAVDWHKTWGYAWGFYAPLFRFCREQHLQAVALNAPRDLAHAVAKLGLDGLDPEQRKQLPEMQPGPEAHREMLREAFGAHPHGKFSQAEFDRFYLAQLVWDETMAQRVSETMAAPNAPHRLVVVAGEGHVRRFAIPDRAVRRGTNSYLVIVPVFDDEVDAARKEDTADVLWALTK